MKTLFTLILVLASVVYAAAQDKIFMLNGKIIECKVTEVGTEEIKYKVSIGEDAAVFAVKKIDVKKIEFADGHVEKFSDELEDADLYANNNKTAWKMDFMSPLYGSAIFSYERSIRPGFSLEGGLGIIGAGLDPDRVKPRGALVRFGPRFMKTPDFRQGSLRYYHVLKGAYIQPLVTFGAFGADQTYYSYDPNTMLSKKTTTRETTTYGSLMVVFGKQSVYSNVFLFDLYAGFGWGFNTTSTKNIPIGTNLEQYQTYRRTYGSLVGTDEMPLAGTLGVRIGFLTK